MKITFFFLIICFLLSPCIFALEVVDDYEDFNIIIEPLWKDDRIFEMGFNTAINASNDFLTIGNIFSNTMVLDLDKIKSGLTLIYWL